MPINLFQQVKLMGFGRTLVISIVNQFSDQRKDQISQEFARTMENFGLDLKNFLMLKFKNPKVQSKENTRKKMDTMIEVF